MEEQKDLANILGNTSVNPRDRVWNDKLIRKFSTSVGCYAVLLPVRYLDGTISSDTGFFDDIADVGIEITAQCVAIPGRGNAMGGHMSAGIYQRQACQH